MQSATGNMSVFVLFVAAAVTLSSAFPAPVQHLVDVTSDGVAKELNALRNNSTYVDVVPADELVINDGVVQERHNFENEQESHNENENLIPFEGQLEGEISTTTDVYGNEIDAGFDRDVLDVLWDMVQKVENRMAMENIEQQKKRSKVLATAGRVGNPMAPHRMMPDDYNLQAMLQQLQPMGRLAQGHVQQAQNTQNGFASAQLDETNNAQQQQQLQQNYQEPHIQGHIPEAAFLSLSRLPANMQRNLADAKVVVSNGALAGGSAPSAKSAKHGGLLSGMGRLNMKASGGPGRLMRVGPKMSMPHKRTPESM